MSRLICLITTSLLFLSSLILATAIFAIVLLQKPRKKKIKLKTAKNGPVKNRQIEKEEAPFGGLEAIAKEGETHLEGFLAIARNGAFHSHLSSYALRPFLLLDLFLLLQKQRKER